MSSEYTIIDYILYKYQFLKFVFQIGDVARKGDKTLTEIRGGDYSSMELGSPNPRYKEGYTSASPYQNAKIGNG